MKTKSSSQLGRSVDLKLGIFVENRDRTIYLTNFKKENIQDEIYVYVQGDYLFVYMESYNYLIWSIRCHGLINGPGEEKVHHRHK